MTAWVAPVSSIKWNGPRPSIMTSAMMRVGRPWGCAAGEEGCGVGEASGGTMAWERGAAWIDPAPNSHAASAARAINFAFIMRPLCGDRGALTRREEVSLIRPWKIEQYRPARAPARSTGWHFAPNAAG